MCHPRRVDRGSRLDSRIILIALIKLIVLKKSQKTNSNIFYFYCLMFDTFLG